jgi:hypothetical protein
VYLPVDDIAVPVGGTWQPVNLLPGTKTWAYLMDQQEPDKDATEQAAVTARHLGDGWIIAAHGPLFSNYFRGHYPSLRRFIGNLIARLELPWDVAVDGPAWLEVIPRRRGENLLINLVNRGAGETLSPTRVIVEQLPALEGVTVAVRCPDTPTEVALLPGDERMQWSHADGLLIISVPSVEIHSVVKIAF